MTEKNKLAMSIIERMLIDSNMSLENLTAEQIQFVLQTAIESGKLTSDQVAKLIQQAIATGNMTAMQLAMIQREFANLQTANVNTNHQFNVIFQSASDLQVKNAETAMKEKAENDLFLAEQQKKRQQQNNQSFDTKK
ncbi:MAG: hypothetical protein EP298_03910 [Gammaproteobacteria bacterium]|nr:MAG: hypothetical protein EP298_03910 [Gammaproteobacteria bacterium]UTW43774.1 hypothetical protein KFE69_06715 [bacterium SCSIO 12844]